MGEYEVAEPYDDRMMQDKQAGYRPVSPVASPDAAGGALSGSEMASLKSAIGNVYAEREQKALTRGIAAIDQGNAYVAMKEAARKRRWAMQDARFALAQDMAQLHRQQVMARANAYEYSNSNPDQEAMYQSMSKELGIPVEQIRENPEAYTQRLSAEQAANIVNNNPAMARYMSNPDNARVAKDDTSVLGAISHAIGVAGSMIRGFGAGLFEGSAGTAAGTVSAYGRAAPVASEMELMSMNPEAISGSEYMQRMEDMTKEGATSTVTIGSDAVYKWSKETADAIAGDAVKDYGILARSLVSGTRSMGSMLPGMALSTLTMNPAAALISGGLSEGSQAFMEDIEKGRGLGTALTHAWWNGSTEVLTELIPVGGYLADVAKKTPFWKRLLKNWARETPSEMAATALQLGGDFVAEAAGDDIGGFLSGSMDSKKYAETMTQYLKQLPEAELETVIAVLPMSFGMTALGSIRTVRAANDMQQALKTLHENGDASKLRGRALDNYRQFIEVSKQGTPIENAYIDAKDFVEYFQSQEIDPKQAAEDFGIKNYEEAVMSNGKLEMPFENYMADFAASGHAQSLIETTTLNENIPSLKDSIVYEERIKNSLERVDKLLDEVDADRETMGGAFESINRVAQEYQRHLEAIGYTPETAATQAQVAARMHVMPIIRDVESRAMAQGREATAEEIANAVSDRLNRYDLKIDRVSGRQVRIPRNLNTQLDPMLAALRAGRIPSASQVYGKTLTQAVIAAGGIQPTDDLRRRVREGELPSRILRKTGRGADELASESGFAGYMRNLDTEHMQEDDALIEALVGEHTVGQMTYDMANLNEDLLAEATMLGYLADDLGRAGIDLAEVTDDAEVRRMLAEYDASKYGEVEGDTGYAAEDTVSSYDQRGFTMSDNPTAEEIAEANRQYDEVVAKYKDTDQWMKAPNGENTNLNERQWVQVRTDNFKQWFGDWERIARLDSYRNRILDWTSPEVVAEIRGKSREQIFEEYDNTPQPIAIIPRDYLQYFKGQTSDDTIYCGKAYFLDHVENHHKDIDVSEYQHIQEILDTPDEVIRDDRNGRDVLVFSKRYVTKNGRNILVAVSLEEDANGRIFMHKSLSHNRSKKPYPKLDRVVLSVDATQKSETPRYVHAPDEAYDGRRLSVLDNSIVQNDYENGNGVSKVVDKNGEPKVMYHGTDSDFDTFVPQDVVHGRELGDGYYFTDDPRRAAGYGGTLMPVFLDVRNPFTKVPSRETATFQDADEAAAFHNEKIAEAEEKGNGYARFEPEVDQLPSGEYTVTYATSFETAPTEANDGYADGSVVVVYDSNQVKSAIGNVGTFNPDNDSILYQTDTDARLSELEAQYDEAVKAEDMPTAERIVREYASLKGYNVDEYRDTHEAPKAAVKKGDFTNLEALQGLADETESLNVYAFANGVSFMPEDFFSARGARMYGYDTAEGMESYRAVKSAMESIQNQMEEYGEVRDMPTVTVYRAVPNSVQEGRLRSAGEWVSPSRLYAKSHGEHRFGSGEFRIIKEKVSADRLWWDGNDINEWGFDDGENYSYKNVKNSRKLLDAVTYDAKGKPVLLAKRFNENRSQTFYQSAFHGTPYRFSRFTLDHMSKGEGGQAHGWGLYFAQDRRVAENYRRGLSSLKTTFKIGRNTYSLDTDSRYFWRDAKGNEPPEHVTFALRKLRLTDGNKTEAISRLMADAEDWAKDKDRETRKGARSFRKAAQWLEKNTLEVQRNEGQLYEVDVPENDVLLDEDKPLPDQPEAVRQAIYDFYASRPDDFIVPKNIDDLNAQSGGAFYREVVRQMEREGVENPQRAASLELNRLGIKGITYDGNRDGRCFVVFDDNAVSILDTYYQSQAQDNRNKRGAFKVTADRRFRIELFEKANFSTFAHECAHFQLEMLSDMVADQNASEYIKQEWQTICDYLGGDIRTLEGDARVEAHERFARSFEAYLMEGKAPSPELRTAFQRFKDWMVRIYQMLTNLNVKLSPDIRQVFDRMLASDAEIAQASEDEGLRETLMTAEDLGLNERETKALKRLYDRQIGEAQDRLRARYMKSFVRQRQQQYREEFAKAQKQAESEYEASALVDVGRMLTNPENRTLALNEAELVKRFGKDYLKQLPKFEGRNIYSKDGGVFIDELAEVNGFESSEDLLQALENMPSKKDWVAQRAQEIVDTFFGDAVNAAEVSDEVSAAMNNDAKGERLRAEMQVLAKAVRAVEEGRKTGRAEASQKLREQYEAQLEELKHKVKEEQVKNRWNLAEADLMQAIAVGKVKSQYQERIQNLMSKIEELKTRQTESKEEVARARREAAEVRKDVSAQYDAMERVAKQAVSEKVVGDIRPNLYLNAMHKAMRESIAALNKATPDYAEAARLKQKEMFNYHLYRAARDAVKQLERGQKKMRDIANRKMEGLPKQRNIEMVYKAKYIAGSLLGRDVSNLVDKIATEEKYQGSDPFVYDIGKLKTLQYADAMKAIEDAEDYWEQSLRDQKILAMGKLVDIETAGGEMAETLASFGPSNRKHNRRDTIKDRFQKAVGNFITSMTRMESWCDMVDGRNVGQETGAWKKYIFNPIKEAAQNARAEQKQYIHELGDILKEFNFTRQTVKMDELGGFVFGEDTGYAKMEIAHAFLHCGNRSNFQRLIVGHGWGTMLEDGTVDGSRWSRAVQTMIDKGIWTEADMDRVQRIWDLMDKLKPKLQEAYKTVNGKYFDEIQAEPVTMFGKEYKGGYVPAIYDPYKSKVGQKQEVKAEDILNTSGSFLAKLSDGFGVTRVQGVPGQLVLDLSKIGSHFNQQVLFANMAPVAADVGKLLRSKGVQAALMEYDPTFYQDVIVPWFSRAVTQNVYNGLPRKDAEERLLQKIRSRAGIATMFMNITNAIEGFFDLTATFSKVDGRHLRNAFMQMVTNRKATVEKILEMSVYMRERMDDNQNAAMEKLEQALHPNRLKVIDNWINDNAYFAQEMIDGFTGPVGFLGAYNQAIEAGLSHEEAVSQAESVVRAVHGTMMPEDLANRETGTVWKRLFTQFTGYFVQRANTVAAQHSKITRETSARQKAALTMLYLQTVFLPAWIGAMLRKAFGGSDDDETFGQWLLDVFGFGTASYVIGLFGATIPGQAASAALEMAQGNKMAQGRMFSSPATQLVANLVNPRRWVDNDGNIQWSNALRNLASWANIVPVIPVVPNRPVASVKYMIDTAEGKVEPTGVVDFVRGAVTGRASPDSKR